MEPSTRKVVTRSPSHTVRLLHLPHVQEEPIEADSSLERDFVQIAGLYPFIKAIQHQPFKLDLGGRYYTPDFLLSFLDETRLVVEVKPQEMLVNHEEKLSAAKAKLEAKGLQFLVATDLMIRHERLAQRALRIRRYAKTTFSKEITDQAVAFVKSKPQGVRMDEVCQQLGLTDEVIYHLIAYHRLCTSTPLDISKESVLFDVKTYEQVVLNGTQTHAIHFTSWLDPSRRNERD